MEVLHRHEILPGQIHIVPIPEGPSEGSVTLMALSLRWRYCGILRITLNIMGFLQMCCTAES